MYGAPGPNAWAAAPPPGYPYQQQIPQSWVVQQPPVQYDNSAWPTQFQTAPPQQQVASRGHWLAADPAGKFANDSKPSITIIACLYESLPALETGALYGINEKYIAINDRTPPFPKATEDRAAHLLLCMYDFLNLAVEETR